MLNKNPNTKFSMDTSSVQTPNKTKNLSTYTMNRKKAGAKKTLKIESPDEA